MEGRPAIGDASATPSRPGAGETALQVGLRALGGVLIVFVFLNLVFLSVHVFDDPVELLTPRDPKVPQELRDANCVHFGLCGPDGRPLPLLERYVLFWDNAWSGDLGMSYYWNLPVADRIGRAIAATLELLVATGIVAFLIGFLLSALARHYRLRGADAASRISGAFLFGLPVVWFALLVRFIALRGPFPLSDRIDSGFQGVPSVTGAYTVDTLLAGRFDAFVNAISHLVLPALVLGLPMAGFAARALRRYAERSVGGPSVATSLTFPVGGLLLGILVLEPLWGWNGLGWTLAVSTSNADVPMALGAIVALGILGIAIAAALSAIGAVLEPTRLLAVRALPLDEAREPGTPQFSRGKRLGLIGLSFVGIILLATALGTLFEATVVIPVVLVLLLALGAFAGWLETPLSAPGPTEPAGSTDRVERVVRAYRRFGKVSSGLLWTGIGLLLAIIGIAALAPFLAPNPWAESESLMKPPDGAHWLGTDALGRDVFSRLLYSARGTLLPVGIALLIPLGVGYLAAAVIVRMRPRRATLPALILDPIRGVPESFLIIVFPFVPLLFLLNSPPVDLLLGLALGIALTPALVRAVRNRLAPAPPGSVWVRGPTASSIHTIHAAMPGLLAALAVEVVLIQTALVYLFQFDPTSLGWASELARADASSAIFVGAWWLFVPQGLMILLLCLALAFIAEGLAGRRETRPWRLPPFPAPAIALAPHARAAIPEGAKVPADAARR